MAEETVIIVDKNGRLVEEGGTGTILRGEDADRYLAGENISISGVGVVNQNEGVVEPAIPDSNAAPTEDDSEASESDAESTPKSRRTVKDKSAFSDPPSDE